jgi:fructose-1,6-bisphosphatase I
VTSLKNRQTLSNFLPSFLGTNSKLVGLEYVITAIANGGQKVHEQVQSAALADALGTSGEINVQGEIVQILDASSSETFVDSLKESGQVAVIGCEELEKPVIVPKEGSGPYMVLMDPLDGSSNIDVAVSIGSIFGIWRHETNEPVTEQSLLRPGHEQVAAAYLVYGSSTVMVIATADGVHGFTLDMSSSNFYLTHPNIRIPDKCPYYSTNEGNFKSLDDLTQKAISDLRKQYSLRYVGSLVADFHRNLLKGGIFLYPADKNRPEGRLRLMYEANPLGYVAEQAGGAASTGRQRIMDIMPEQLHQRTPLILGNNDVVEKTVEIISG